MEATERLKLLADASRYDLSCACGTQKDEHRKRGPDGIWLYPATLPGGGTSIMLKTLLSNACVNDCRYCPLRAGRDSPAPRSAPKRWRSLHGLLRAGQVLGLFLSCGVIAQPGRHDGPPRRPSPRCSAAAPYPGYLHLKVIPGAPMPPSRRRSPWPTPSR